MKQIILILLVITTSLSIYAQPETIYKVTTIPSMKLYFGYSSRIRVISTNSDYVLCSACTSDEITIFAGAGGRKWRRMVLSDSTDYSSLTQSADSSYVVIYSLSGKHDTISIVGAGGGGIGTTTDTTNRWVNRVVKNATGDSFYIFKGSTYTALKDNIGGGGGTVTVVTGSGNIASSGGTTPNITFTGILPIVNGGTGTASPSLIAGANITITGSFPNQTINSSGGGTSYTTQTYTSGATVTISNASNWLIVNPASLLSALLITMPATPVDQEEVTISFGGTITGGNEVINQATAIIVANTGQSLVENFDPLSFQSGESVTYKYNLSTTKWYAK